MKTKLYIPEHFDFASAIDQSRHHLLDRIRYFIHTIYMLHLQDQRLDEQGVRLKTEYFRNLLGRSTYKDVLSDLVDSGALIIDNHYRQGEYSRLYKFGPAISGRTFRQYRPTDKHVNMVEQKEITPLVNKEHKYLNRQLGRVEISEQAYQWIDHNIDNDHKKMLAKGKVDQIRDKYWRFVADEHWRVHHNVTSLNRDLRKFLTVDGERLVEIDIGSSQPIFLGLLFLNWINNDRSLDKIHSTEGYFDLKPFRVNDFLKVDTSKWSRLNQIDQYLPESLEENEEEKKPKEKEERNQWKLSSSSPLRWHGLPKVGDLINHETLGNKPFDDKKDQKTDVKKDDSFDTNKITEILYKKDDKKALTKVQQRAVNEAVKYLQVCESIGLYRYLAKQANHPINTTDDYDNWKVEVYRRLLYAYRDCTNDPVVMTFKKEFPTIHKLIRLVRKTDKGRLACWMQRQEAAFIIHTCVKRLITESPGQFLLTIHDSIMTTESNAQRVEQVIRHEFWKRGVIPTIKTK